MTTRRLRLLLALAVPLWIVWLVPQWVEARAPRTPSVGGPFTVTAVSDAPDFFPGDGVCEIGAENGICTLRAAIQEANAWPGVDTILFSSLIPTPTTFLLTRSGDDDTAVNGDLDITADLIIVGRGPLATIIDGGGMITRDSAIEVRVTAQVTISGVTIQDAGTASLAAVEMLGHLSLRDCVVADNPGRAIRVNAGRRLAVENSRIRANQTGVYVSDGTAHISGSVLSGNWDHAMYLASGNNMWITSSTIISNGTTGQSIGGGLEVGNSPVSVYDTLFQGNRALQGGGLASFGQSGAHRILNSRFVSNTASDYGGALSGHATLIDSVLEGNQAGRGGGIYLEGSGGTLSHTVIQHNVALTEGGGIYVEAVDLEVHESTIADNQAASRGGGIFDAGGLRLAESTVARNRSLDLGAGLYVSATSANDAHVVNSTLSGNLANGSGGGIFLLTGTLRLTHTTVYSNGADDNYNGTGLGGGVRQAGGTLYVRSSILARNRLRMNVNLYVQDDCSGTIQSLNYNFIGDLGGCTVLGSTSLNQTGALTLGPLKRNGGPTETHVPPRGNTVIDGAINTACPATDQRGTPRPFDGNGNGFATCDIGAVEYLPDLFLPLILR